MMLGLFETRIDRKRPKRFAQVRRDSRLAAVVDYTAIRELGCRGCSLLTKDLTSPKMLPTGSAKPCIYVLGEAPGETEDDEGKQFVGRTGKLLREVLADEFGDSYSFRWNNCCRCRPPANRKPEVVECEHCRNSIIADIEACKPKVLLGVGGTALWWATGEAPITRWRGKLLPVEIGQHRCWFYPVLHPSFVQRSTDDSGWDTAFRHDLRRLCVRVDEGLGKPSLEPLSTLYAGVQYARNARGLTQLNRQLVKWSGNKAIVAFDIETCGLRPYSVDTPVTGWLSIAFSDGEITWAVPVSHDGAGWSPDEKQQLLRIVLAFLRGKAIKIAHCLPFELEWLTSIYGHTPPWRRVGWGDTMTQAYTLDARRDGLSLDRLIQQRFGFKLKQQSNVDRSALAQLPIDRLLKYNALDAKYTAQLHAVQYVDLVREGLVSVYKFQLKRTLTLVKAQQVGLPVDFDCVGEFKRLLDNKIKRLLDRVRRSDEAELYRSKRGAALSVTSPSQLVTLFRDLLQRPEGKRSSNKSGYSVDDASLSAIDLPIASNVLAVRRYSKLLSTYVDTCGRTGGVVYPDGRIHTKFNDLFTVTGRLSSDGPNMQNFPKRKDAWIRALVVPPKGCVMVSSDYGQIEYRVIGIASKDKRICDSLRDRYDVHLDWAERVAKADPKVYRAMGKDIKQLRSEIKNTWVFPAFYGAHADYIARMLNMDLRICRELFEEFWEEFAGVRAWQRKLLKGYKRLGYVSCLTGRRRWAPLSKNMVFNTPIQGSASDIVVDAMCRLSVRAERDDEPSLQPVLNIHDDLVFCVPKKRLDAVLPIIVDEMLRPSFSWVTVPISVEVAVGPNWADMTARGTYFSDDR